ncbi:uncharacterized protein LOC142558414 [Dermacentor variabilis]|uniref:uncharacterized protein LOC142558414 n=1 Tax=Dermacentor variabilis TaxID=34621 RepID=UPI003F5C08B6
MAGGNDCLDARAVTFSLERILRTGSLCPSQASNVENGQTVLSMHGASLNVTSSEFDVPAEAKAQATTHDSTETAQVAPARFTGTEDFVMHIDELFTSLKAMPHECTLVHLLHPCEVPPKSDHFALCQGYNN